MKIQDLEWKSGSPVIIWTCDGSQKIRKSLLPLQSVCLINGADGIAVVEAMAESGPQNALILDCEGSIRFRLGLPFSGGSAKGYDSIRYIQQKLTAIFVTTLGDWAVEIDPFTGDLGQIRETR